MRYRSVVLIGLLVCSIMAMSLALTPRVEAVWSTTNPGINYWVTPNWLDNGGDNVYYGGAVWPVDDITYGWQTTQYFYLNVKSDNYPNNANLKWVINGVIYGPVPSSNWVTNGWVGFQLWSASSGSWTYSGATDGIVLSDVDNNETFLARIAFNFQNEIIYQAGGFFPAEVKVQLKLYNTDNAEVYWTPTLTWWVWDYPLENVINYAVADTYTRTNSPNNNYGTATTAVVAGAAGDPAAGWLKFPLTAPPNWGVQHAYLRYYVDSSSGSPLHNYIKTLENVTWIEHVITYNNSGGFTPTAYATSSTEFTIDAGWQSINITDIIRPRISAGDSQATIFLVMASTTPVVTMTIRTKEYGDGSYAPQLILELASMGPSTPPTFDVVLGTAVTDWSGDYANVLLRGRVDNMGDDSSANFTFYVNNLQWGAYKTYTYPTAVTSTGFFSLSTTGYQYHRGSMYYIRLLCHGNNTQTYTWIPASDWYVFTVENTLQPPPPIGRLPCTLTTTDVKGVTESGATVYFSLTVGANNSLSVYIDLGENADNLDNYMSFNYGAYTWSATGYSWSSSHVLSGLDNGATYYVRARGVDAGFAVVNGGWMMFTTLTSAVPPVKPPSQAPGTINIRSLPDIIGDLLFGGVSDSNGVSSQHDVAGIFIVAVVSIVIIIVLAKFKVPSMGIIGALIIQDIKNITYIS